MWFTNKVSGSLARFIDYSNGNLNFLLMSNHKTNPYEYSMRRLVHRQILQRNKIVTIFVLS